MTNDKRITQLNDIVTTDSDDVFVVVDVSDTTDSLAGTTKKVERDTIFGQDLVSTASPTFTGLTVDTNTLYVDSINHRVGIGTTSPSAKLDIEDPSFQIQFGDGSGARTKLRTIDSSGNSLFDINPFASVNDGTKESTIRFFRNTNSSNASIQILNSDGTTGINHLFYGSGNSYLCANNGNVGIGTRGPSAKLEVNSTNPEVQRIKRTGSTGNSALGFFNDNESIFIGLNNAGGFGISTSSDIGGSSVNIATFDDSGNVGIGITSPTAKLHTYNNTADSTIIAKFIQDNSGSTGDVVQIQDDGTGNGLYIDQNGNSRALLIQSEATTADVIRIDHKTTTGRGLVISGTGVQTRTGLNSANVITNSAASTGTLMHFEYQSSGASGNVIAIVNDGTGNGLYIDQNGNGIALLIDSEATSQPLISLNPINANTRGDIAFNTARTDDPSNPSEGDVWYNSTSHQFKGYNGTSVVVLG